MRKVNNCNTVKGFQVLLFNTNDSVKHQSFACTVKRSSISISNNLVDH